MQGPGPVAAGVVQAHERPPGRLLERVLAQQPLGVRDRPGVVAALGEQRHQPLQGLEAAPAEPLPVLGQPLVVQALEQVAPVQGDGAGQRLRVAVGQLLEGGHVQPEGRVGPPGQRPWRHLQVAVQAGEGAAEGVEQVAEVGPGLRLGRVRPQQEGQPPARLGRLAVEQQVGEQRQGTGRLQRRQRRPAEAEVGCAEQPDAQVGRLHGPSPLPDLRVPGRRSSAGPEQAELVLAHVVSSLLGWSDQATAARCRPGPRGGRRPG